MAQMPRERNGHGTTSRLDKRWCSYRDIKLDPIHLMSLGLNLWSCLARLIIEVKSLVGFKTDRGALTILQISEWIRNSLWDLKNCESILRSEELSVHHELFWIRPGFSHEMASLWPMVKVMSVRYSIAYTSALQLIDESRDQICISVFPSWLKYREFVGSCNHRIREKEDYSASLHWDKVS